MKLDFKTSLVLAFVAFGLLGLIFYIVRKKKVSIGKGLIDISDQASNLDFFSYSYDIMTFSFEKLGIYRRIVDGFLNYIISNIDYILTHKIKKLLENPEKYESAILRVTGRVLAMEQEVEMGEITQSYIDENLQARIDKADKVIIDYFCIGIKTELKEFLMSLIERNNFLNQDWAIYVKKNTEEIRVMLSNYIDKFVNGVVLTRKEVREELESDSFTLFINRQSEEFFASVMKEAKKFPDEIISILPKTSEEAITKEEIEKIRKKMVNNWRQ